MAVNAVETRTVSIVLAFWTFQISERVFGMSSFSVMKMTRLQIG